VDDVFRHTLDAFLTAKDAVEESPLPELPLEADGPGQQCASALESANPCREGKPPARQLDKEMEVVGHETPGVKSDFVVIGIRTEL
jgi:single-stranded DNA-specific DHH superfamily exonuclease